MANFILVGFRKRVGKDTFSKMLKDNIKSDNVIIVPFARALKEIIADSFSISLEELDDYKNSQTSIIMGGQIITNMRSVLQNFGSGKMKEYFGKDLWVKLVKDYYKDYDGIVIIPDFRFPEEYIEDSITINITNTNLSNWDTHISEVALEDFNFDYKFDNCNSLNDLNKFAKKVAKDVNKRFL